MADAHSDGLVIRYDDTGVGEPALLCLPGWCASRAKYDDFARAMATHRRVLTLDWRGHGRSDPAPQDFGFAELVKDALAVIEASGARQVVPLATAHAGWVAIELRRRLGPQRIPGIVLVDWMVTAAPPPFVGALAALQDPAQWPTARDRLFATWIDGVDDAAVVRFVREDMGTHGFPMWARAGREIAAAYARAGSPLAELARLDPPPPTLHLQAQPVDAGALMYGWFHAERIDARSHFPTLETPERLVDPIERFVSAAR